MPKPTTSAAIRRPALIGRGRRGNVEQAALINGAAGHAHDYDDVHMAMNGHPTVPVAPAVLALAEHHHKGAKALLAAFAAGVDTECIIGRYLGASHYAEGWHATGTLGSFGAAAAAANLLGLDAETTARALGIAGTQAAGLKSQFGTMCKPLHAGHAAAIGVQAARLAARGFTSRTDILEIAQGFAATQGHGASAERFNRALIEDSYLPGICFKYHAACYMTHSSIEAIRELVDTHRIAAERRYATSRSPSTRVTSASATSRRRTTGLEAKFSLRFTAAMALSRPRYVRHRHLHRRVDARSRNSSRCAIKVRVVAWPEARPETRVRIGVGDRTFETATNVGIPLTDLDAQWTKLTRKFHALVDPLLGGNGAAQLVETCRQPRTRRRPRRLLAPDPRRRMSEPDFRSRAKLHAKGNRFEDMTEGRVFEHHWGRTHHRPATTPRSRRRRCRSARCTSTNRTRRRSAIRAPSSIRCSCSTRCSV